MAPSILVFDFGADEALAQQARHKVDGWKQGFRLGNKMQLKFERQEASSGNGEPADADAVDKETPKSKPAPNSAKQSKREGDAESSSHVRVLLRLDFSDHEKLSQQRWLDRIPAEEPFRSAKGETIRAADTEFDKISALFESLD